MMRIIASVFNPELLLKVLMYCYEVTLHAFFLTIMICMPLAFFGLTFTYETEHMPTAFKILGIFAALVFVWIFGIYTRIWFTQGREQCHVHWNRIFRYFEEQFRT